MLDTPTLDILEKLVHIVGIPAIAGAIVWLIRSWTRFDARAGRTEKLAQTTLNGVNLIQTNHLEHLAEDVRVQKEKQELTVAILGDQTKVLQNMDKNLGILVDRGTRI